MNIYSLTKIGKRYRNIARYRQIIYVLIKYGFEDLIHRSKISKYIDYSRRLANKEANIEPDTSTEVRIRKVFEELGTTFIKFGQILSSRPDIFHEGLIQELKKLQDRVPSFPREEAIQLFENEINKKIEDVFDYFDPIPLASASIAQVHRAKLKNGHNVVVKIQRPGIKKLIDVDIEIMQHLALIIEKNLPEAKYIRPMDLIEEFAISIEKELDFTIEASNLERFSANFKNDENIVVPQLYKKYCSEKILTMEYIEGKKLNEFLSENISTFDRREIADRGSEAILKQIFIDGFFHGDPHPGNILILNGNKICFLDYGIMGKLYGKSKEDVSDLIISIIKDDNKLLIKSLINLSYSCDLSDKDKFEREVCDLADEIKYKNIKDINLTKLFQRLIKIIVNHKYRIKSNFYLLMKTIITMDGIGRELYPEFNLVLKLEPFVKELLKNKIKPSRIFDESKSFTLDLIDLIKSFPENLSEIITKIKSGKIHIEMEHKGLDNLIERFEATYNRVIIAIIVASLFVSSSLIILSKIPPTWHDISVIGITGFFIASILGIILIIKIIKK